MKDKILCAIDFSESSAAALQWAGKLAKASRANLAVLYSYRLLQTGKLDDLVSFLKRTEEESRRMFAEISKSALTSETPATFITEIGFYSDNVENFVRKNPMTIVVLSEEMANSIYDHKGSLLQFLKSLKVPLLIVPHLKEEGIHGELSNDMIAV